jgi:hypothetical protein
MKVSKTLEKFQKILNSSKCEYSIQLSAFPTKNPNIDGAHISLQIKSDKDKDFALKQLDAIYKEWERQNNE